MAENRKQIGIRLDNESVEFVTTASKLLGLHHKLSADIPDMSATIRHFITVIERLDKAEINIHMLEALAEGQFILKSQN